MININKINTNFILIVEGCDGVGKGYLIEQLSKKLKNMVIIKNLDRPLDNSIKERLKIKNHYLSMLYTTNIFNNVIITFDRFYFSELVYSIKRGYEAGDDSFFKTLERDIREIPHLFVLVDRNSDEIKNVFQTRGEDYTKENEIDIIKNRYLEFFNKSKLNKLRINSSESDKVIEEIKRLW